MNTDAPMQKRRGFWITLLIRMEKRRGFWITLAVIVVLLLAGGSFGYYTYQIRSTPEKTFQAFCNALVSGDYQTAYNQLASPVRYVLTEQKFVFNFQHGLQGLSKCTLNDEIENVASNQGEMFQYGGFTYVTRYTGEIFYAGDISYIFPHVTTSSEPVFFINESGIWKLYAILFLFPLVESEEP